MVQNKIIMQEEDEVSETTGLLPGSANNNKNGTEGKRLVRSVYILSLAFMVHFTASSSIGQLQSSINPDEGLGVYSRASAYGAMLFSALFLPTFLIQRFSAKTTIIFAMLGFTMYMGAQFYPRFSTLVPTGVIMGLSAAPLWSAKSTYVTLVAQRYAELMNDKPELVMGRFFGIFSFLFHTAKIWGNVLASTILSSGKNPEKDVHSRNTSVCGSDFCPADAQQRDVIVHPEMSKVYTLLTVYVTLAFVGVGIVIFFLDPLKKSDDKTEKSGHSGHPIVATFLQMTNPIQILIIPLTLWSGLEQGFFIADYYQAYVTCSWGVENLGYVIICYGMCNALSSISLDPIIRRIGRFPIFIIGALINFVMIFTMLKWHPQPSQPVILFVVAGLWGIADSVWHTQLKGLYGALFHGTEEAAFSNYTLWESIGFIVAFANGNLLCVNLKLYSLSGVLTTGMFGYFMIEIIQLLKRNKNC